MSNNENNFFFDNNTNLYMVTYESSPCEVPPNPKLSQKQLYKLAKQNSSKIEGDFKCPDFNDFGNFDSFDENLSYNFDKSKSKRSLKIFSF